MSKKYDNNLNEIKETRTFATNTTIDSKDLGTLGVYFEREMANKKIEGLKQQLAEKNKEMQEWKDGTMIVKYEQQLAEKDKEIRELKSIIFDDFNLDTSLIEKLTKEKYICDFRHQICEEIREKAVCTKKGYKDYYIISSEILDQIEKGE